MTPEIAKIIEAAHRVISGPQRLGCRREVLSADVDALEAALIAHHETEQKDVYVIYSGSSSCRYIERVALAIKHARGDYFTAERAGTPLPFSLDAHLARAAIAAMREPTPEMRQAAFNADSHEAEWKAMIDAALKGETQ
jgi:hypothetical protein